MPFGTSPCLEPWFPVLWLLTNNIITIFRGCHCNDKIRTLTLATRNPRPKKQLVLLFLVLNSAKCHLFHPGKVDRGLNYFYLNPQQFWTREGNCSALALFYSIFILFLLHWPLFIPFYVFILTQLQNTGLSRIMWPTIHSSCCGSLWPHGPLTSRTASLGATVVETGVMHAIVINTLLINICYRDI